MTKRKAAALALSLFPCQIGGVLMPVYAQRLHNEGVIFRRQVFTRRSSGSRDSGETSLSGAAATVGRLKSTVIIFSMLALLSLLAVYCRNQSSIPGIENICEDLSGSDL